MRKGEKSWEWVTVHKGPSGTNWERPNYMSHRWGELRNWCTHQTRCLWPTPETLASRQGERRTWDSMNQNSSQSPLSREAFALWFKFIWLVGLQQEFIQPRLALNLLSSQILNLTLNFCSSCLCFPCAPPQLSPRTSGICFLSHLT